MSYTVGSLIKGTISKIAFGGAGILRTEDNFVIFVPYTAPQDVITCQLTEVKKGYAKAKLVEIHSKSPFRIAPKCPHFASCGGCQLQHIEYSEQIVAKEQAVLDSLRKFAGQQQFPFVMHSAKLQWHYRRHIYLTLKASDKGFKIGYIADDHHSFLPIDVCPIFVDLQDPILAEVQAIASHLSTTQNDSGKLMIAKESDGEFLLHFHFKQWSQANYKILQASGKKFLISSATKTLGSAALFTRIGPLNIHYSSSSFMQNHPEESHKIYQAIASIAEKARPKAILDLYCGIGISSLMLAAKAESLVGIEENAKAVELAKINARENHILNVTFQLGKVERLLPNVMAKTWDFILLNPPRTGLEKEVVATVLTGRPKDIVYVSCMPATLARDLRFFVEKGYEIQQCQAFDMFPQTTHVETLVHLRRIA